MKLHSHRSALGALAITAAFLLGACGTSGGDDSADKKDVTTTTAADETTTTEADETTTTEAEVDEDAQDRADAVDLTLSDFPDGWESAPHEEDDGPGLFDDCDPSFADDSTTVAEHDIDDFTIGDIDALDATQFRASTKVFTDEDAAIAALDPFNDADIVACMDGELKAAFNDGEGATVDGELDEDDIDADIGADQSEGLSATYTINADDGSTATVNVAFLVIRTGDLGTLVTIQSAGESFDPSTLQDPILRIAELQSA